MIGFEKFCGMSPTRFEHMNADNQRGQAFVDELVQNQHTKTLSTSGGLLRVLEPPNCQVPSHQLRLSGRATMQQGLQITLVDVAESRMCLPILVVY
jgi:hypothetical protein